MPRKRIEISASWAAIMAVAVKAIAELHNLPSDVVVNWIQEVDLNEIKLDVSDTGRVREGTVRFVIGREPSKTVFVSVRIQEIVAFGEDTWVGQFVSIRASAGFMAYSLDWKTGSKLDKVTFGQEYPYGHITL